MVDEKEVIATALFEYVDSDPQHPDMKLFSSVNNFKPMDVANIIRETNGLTKPQKDLLLRSFTKNEMKEEVQPIVKISNHEWARIRRSDLKARFNKFEGSVEDFLKANPEIPESQLRNVIPREVYIARCKNPPRKKRNSKDFEDLVKVFINLPDKSVEDFCEEQKISMQTFEKYVPAEIWNERRARARRRIDWESEKEAMIASGKSLEEWAHTHNLQVTVFKEKCGKEVVRLYDENGRKAEHFNPEASLEENAKMLELSAASTSKWIEKYLKELAPEKYRRFKMDEKDLRIEQLLKEKEQQKAEIEQLKKSLRNLEGILANKNSYIGQMKITQAQKAAKVAAAKKTLEALIKEL